MMAWLDGVDLDKLNSWRRQLRDRADPPVLRTVNATAEQLRAMKGTLPVQSVVQEHAAYHKADEAEVIAYLASLGMALMVCLSPQERG